VVDVVTVENEFIALTISENLGDEFGEAKLLPRVDTLRCFQSKFRSENFLKK